MAVLVKKKGGEWREAKVLRYFDEREFQKMLYSSPQLIPVQGELTKTRVFIDEAGLTGAGYTDLIGVDNDGEIYLVECKLATNPEIRREVIGQILEYASFLWEMSYEDFDSLFVKRKGNTLKGLLTEGVVEGWEFEAFRGAVTENLKTGNFHLIIAVDEMSEQLEEIIGFLGKRGAGVRLQAIELQRYVQDDAEILVPQLHGEIFQFPKGDRKRVAWSFESFFAEAKRRLSEERLTALTTLYEFSKHQTGWLSWGKGTTYGSVSVHIDRISSRSLYALTTNGHFVANFGQLQDGEAALKFRDNLGQRLKNLGGLKVPANYQGLWLSIPPDKWTPVADKIIDALNGVLQQQT
jgi:hypothetical protein